MWRRTVGNGVGAHLTRKHTGGVIILIGMATRFTHRHTHAYDARPATQRVVSSRAATSSAIAPQTPATATAGTPAAGRKRMMSIEVLRLLAIVCIALGVAIPNIFFRRFVEGDRKRKLFNMLVERKRKNGEFVDLSAVEIK